MTPIDAALPRHTLVWLLPTAAGQIERGLPPVQQDQVRRWLAQGRPFVRRRPSVLPETGLSLGMPLPPQLGRERIGITASQGLVRSVAPPPRLAEVISAAPAAWRAPLAKLAARLELLQTPARLYGSLAWQYLTGMEYLTASSDIDLLLPVNTQQQLKGVLAALVDWEQETGLRADGELMLPTGEAVAWRELVREPSQVLVKSLAGAALLPWQALLERL